MTNQSILYDNCLGHKNTSACHRVCATLHWAMSVSRPSPLSFFLSLHLWCPQWETTRLALPQRVLLLQQHTIDIVGCALAHVQKFIAMNDEQQRDLAHLREGESVVRACMLRTVS